MVFSNAPAAITIGNLITFTNWDDLITSTSYTFKAQSSVPNVDWEIDIYDWIWQFRELSNRPFERWEHFMDLEFI